MITKYTWLLPVLLIPFGFALQDENQHKKRANQKEVDAAIEKGVKYLISKYENFGPNPGDSWIGTSLELTLYALTHAQVKGVNEKHPVFKKLLEKMLADKPATKQTYNLAIEAMTLLSLDPVKYQDRMAEIAQALVDRQCKNGAWQYIGTTAKSDINTPHKPKEDVTTNDKKKGLKKIQIKRQGWGLGLGDLSNTQYAALGLRACFEANIEFDKDTIKLAKECYEKSQNDDGGWDYSYKENPNRPGSRTGMDDPHKKKPADHMSSTGSMTVGALGALASYRHMLKEDYKKDPTIKAGIEWLGKNFAVDKNPGMNPGWHYYYLYGLERAGALAGVDKFGSHDWYDKGSQYLLKNQKEDGSWSSSSFPPDTCFAILFLRRATEHLFSTH